MLPQKRLEYCRLPFDHIAWIEHQFFSGMRDSRKAGSLWGMIGGVGGARMSIQQSWLATGLGLGLLCWGFKLVQEEIPKEEASTLQIGSVAFPLVAFPPVHNSILVTDYLTKMGIKTVHPIPIVQTLHSVTFGYSLSSEAVVMRQWRRWKRLWRRSLTRSHKWTSMGGHPEVVGTVQQVHCSRRKLFRKELEFHVCTIDKSTHKKKVWKLIVCTSYMYQNSCTI